MSGANVEDVKEHVHEQEMGTSEKHVVDDEQSVQEQTDTKKNNENPIPTPQQEEEIIKKKYGGMLAKKPPLISKDHERAFFDSTDWALGKQGAQKPKGTLEALRPELQPTPHQQVRSRRSAYAPSDDEDADRDHNNVSSEDPSCASEWGNNSNDPASVDQSSRVQLAGPPE